MGVPVYGGNGLRPSLSAQIGDFAREDFKGLLPGNARELARTSRPHAYHGAGKADILVVEELKPTHPDGTDATGVDRVIRPALDLDGPLVHLSNLDSASSRAEQTDGLDMGEGPVRWNGDPWPILGPDGDVVRELPGQRRDLEPGHPSDHEFYEISSVQFHPASVEAFAFRLLAMKDSSDQKSRAAMAPYHHLWHTKQALSSSCFFSL